MKSMQPWVSVCYWSLCALKYSLNVDLMPINWFYLWIGKEQRWISFVCVYVSSSLFVLYWEIFEPNNIKYHSVIQWSFIKLLVIEHMHLTGCFFDITTLKAYSNNELRR